MRLTCLPLLVVPLVVALRAEPARAAPDDPCGPYGNGFFNVPHCKAQKQATLTFDADFSSGYAFYCAGDHPYFLEQSRYWHKEFHMGQFLFHCNRKCLL